MNNAQIIRITRAVDKAALTFNTVRTTLEAQAKGYLAPELWEHTRENLIKLTQANEDALRAVLSDMTLSRPKCNCTGSFHEHACPLRVG